ncbi:MAG: hypothetical protein K0S49_2894 [Microbacterium sp.]|nr:hypothetical protein [Microbacterium sp.]
MGVPFVELLERAPSAVRITSADSVCQFHLATVGTPWEVVAFQSWSTISRRGSPSNQARKFAAGIFSPISSPVDDFSWPTGEFHAASPPMAHPSAPAWRGSMSPAAARPVSSTAGIDHSTSPVRASRMVAPRLPDAPISSWAANTS